jgi:Na+-translocating ferredoxin:NAD+ oxidoreductase RnfG subunit
MRIWLIILLSVFSISAVTLPAVAHDTGFPEQTLKSIYPHATGFTSRKKLFTKQQVQAIEQSAGTQLHKNDNPLTFYAALGKSSDGTGVLGLIVVVDVVGPKGPIDLAIGVARDGTIHRVMVSENSDDPGLSEDRFLSQFKGFTTKSLMAIPVNIEFEGATESAQAFIDAVRRGLQLLETASGN